MKTLKADHVYQNYLVGQIHSFKGQLFNIKSIDEQSGIVSTEKVPLPDSLIYYRHIHHITCKNVDQFLESFHQKELRHYVVTKALYESEMTIETSQYYTFTKGLNFNEGFTITKLDHNRKVPPRPYKHGRILQFNITNKNDDDTFPAHQQLSIILAFVFNELFRSVFPDYFQYIHATTPFLENDTQYKNDRFVSLIPTITFNSENESDHDRSSKNSTEKESDDDMSRNHPLKCSNAISILLTEDSTHDMGLIKAVYDNLDYLFMVIEDFLAWIINKNQFFTHFIYEEDSLIRNEEYIKQTWNVIRELIDKDKSKLETCDNCKKLIEGTYEMRKGRKICKECLKYCVETQKDLEKHLLNIKKWIADTYQEHIPEINAIQFATPAIIKNRKFRLHQNSFHEADASQTRLFIEKKPYDMKTYHLAVEAIAIESTLIWQKKYLDIEQINKQFPGVLYTHATWVASRYLHEKNNPDPQPIVKAHCQKVFNSPSFIEFEKLFQSAHENNPFNFLKIQCSKSDKHLIDNAAEELKTNENVVQRFINYVKSIFFIIC